MKRSALDLRLHPSDGLSARLETRAGWLVATLDGELTTEAVPGLRRALESFAGQGLGLVLDLSQVRFLDSSGIGLLTALSTRARDAGAGVWLLDPSPQAVKTLELVRLLPHFTIIRDFSELGV